jgi:SAM-dependent methyltransferase
MRVHAVTTFCAVLRTAAPGSHAADRLVSSCGRAIPMPIERWWAPPSAGELTVLDDAIPSALDVGCGPARHVLALEERGVEAVGLDSSEEAVRAARSRGAAVLHGSIFDDVPSAGGWGTALMFDGNIGIGGDPVPLLARVHRVLRPGGRALVEVEPPAVATSSLLVRAASPSGPVGDWFPWAQVSATDLGSLAAACGFTLATLREIEGRWFGRLERG